MKKLHFAIAVIITAVLLSFSAFAVESYNVSAVFYIDQDDSVLQMYIDSLPENFKENVMKKYVFTGFTIKEDSREFKELYTENGLKSLIDLLSQNGKTTNVPDIYIPFGVQSFNPTKLLCAPYDDSVDIENLNIMDSAKAFNSESLFFRPSKVAAAMNREGNIGLPTYMTRIEFAQTDTEIIYFETKSGHYVIPVNCAMFGKYLWKYVEKDEVCTEKEFMDAYIYKYVPSVFGESVVYENGERIPLVEIDENYDFYGDGSFSAEEQTETIGITALLPTDGNLLRASVKSDSDKYVTGYMHISAKGDFIYEVYGEISVADGSDFDEEMLQRIRINGNIPDSVTLCENGNAAFTYTYNALAENDEGIYNGFVYRLREADGATYAYIHNYIADELNGKDVVVPGKIGEYEVKLDVDAFARSEFLSCDLSELSELYAYMFRGSTTEKIILPECIKEMFGFNNSGIKIIDIPAGVEKVSENAFVASKLEEAYVPSTVTEIGCGAFVNDSLKKIVIENGIEHIGTDTPSRSAPAAAIYSPLLTEVFIPESVTYISPYEFKDSTVDLEKGNISVGTYPENMVIYGKADSYAEIFANQNGIKFISAETYGKAEKLYELGLFRGTGSYYSGKPVFDLEKASNRVEGLVMLIRLLGAEKQAEAHEKTHPFTDVPEWADGYVSYACENGLTNGISEELFGADNILSAEMYKTFVLRALGYSDGENGDFTWDNPDNLAYAVGISDNTYDTEFERCNMVDIAYSALFSHVKGSSVMLYEKLMSEGVINDDDFERVFFDMSM